MANQGKWVIVGILVTAVVAASGAWYYQFVQGRRVLEQWGPENALRMRLAPQCTLFALQPSPASTETDTAERQTLSIGGGLHWVTWQRELAGTPGFVHARQALIQDASYAWDATTVDTGPWSYALRFVDDAGVTLLAFDLEHNVIANADTLPQRANIGPISQGLQKYFGEQSTRPER